MTSKNSLGMTGLAALHRFVHRIDDDRRLLSGLFDFEEIAVSGPALEARTGQRSVAFRAGDCVIVSTEPLTEQSEAGRFLRRHPEGIGALTLAVEDVGRAFTTLERAGGTPLGEVQWWQDGLADVGTFSVATPLDDVLFHFVGPRAGDAPLPGFLRHRAPRGGGNRFGFRSFDHVTSNFLTMAPAVLWFQHVLGLVPHWGITFHTSDAAPHGEGSGLRSKVLWDPRSGLKFANNEPLRPNFEASQISAFCGDQRGSGVQHVAIVVDDIVGAVSALRARGARFARTPAAYYDRLPERLAHAGILHIEEDLEVLRAHEILVDGSHAGRYLLQIFLEDGARVGGDPGKGPFFFELIQRRGDDGFGAGNFRALFESIASSRQELRS
jgi:4-hydroxyphenylpyruvate dioxygenase